MKSTNGEFITNFPHTNSSKYLRPIFLGGGGGGGGGGGFCKN